MHELPVLFWLEAASVLFSLLVSLESEFFFQKDNWLTSVFILKSPTNDHYMYTIFVTDIHVYINAKISPFSLFLRFSVLLCCISLCFL